MTEVKYYAGGVTGENYYGRVENCKNFGVVNGREGTGGIIGDNSGRIENCYNAADVTGDYYIGGIVGFDNSDYPVSNCYYLAGKGLSNGYGAELTRSQMQQSSSFAGFDFKNVWSIAANTNNGYPYFRQNKFTDIPYDSAGSVYYVDAVIWATDNGITSGVSEHEFGPELSVSRAQFITFLWRAAGSPKAFSSARFDDVSQSDYFFDAVNWAVANGITQGTGANIFGSNNVCTRAQVVTFLARFAGVADAETYTGYADVAPHDYFAAAVKWAAESGITHGTSDSMFSPYDKCSRAQVVTFLYRMLG